MNRDHVDQQVGDNPEPNAEQDTTPELEGISPLNPSTFPRAEDDDVSRAHSSDFHDVPDPGPNVGRGNPGHDY